MLHLFFAFHNERKAQMSKLKSSMSVSLITICPSRRLNSHTIGFRLCLGTSWRRTSRSLGLSSKNVFSLEVFSSSCLISFFLVSFTAIEVQRFQASIDLYLWRNYALIRLNSVVSIPY